MTTPEEVEQPEILPTAKIFIVDPDNANEEIRVGLEALKAEGKRPWAEVHFGAPDHLTDAEKAKWLERQTLFSFDALELVDGVAVPLPPYSELIRRAES